MTSLREEEEEDGVGLISGEQGIRGEVETEFEVEDITDVTTVEVAEMDAVSTS